MTVYDFSFDGEPASREVICPDCGESGRRYGVHSQFG
jgi:hypothetical protein